MSAVSPLDRLATIASSTYWLRFVNGRWLIYRHERQIAAFAAENADTALAFLRHKQSEAPEDCK